MTFAIYDLAPKTLLRFFIDIKNKFKFLNHQF